MRPANEFIVYKGERFITMGTTKEIAEFLGVKTQTVAFYRTQAYRDRVAARKNPRNYITIEWLLPDEDE